MEMPEDDRIYWYEFSLAELNKRREQEQEAQSRQSFSPISL